MWIDIVLFHLSITVTILLYGFILYRFFRRTTIHIIPINIALNKYKVWSTLSSCKKLLALCGTTGCNFFVPSNKYKKDIVVVLYEDETILSVMRMHSTCYWRGRICNKCLDAHTLHMLSKL